LLNHPDCQVVSVSVSILFLVMKGGCIVFCEINFEKKKLIFDNPIDIIQTYSLSEIPKCFYEIEKAINSGHYLAGFLSYEAGYAFEETLKQKDNFDFPLLCFGVYAHPMPHPTPSPMPTPDPSRRVYRDTPLRDAENDFNLSKPEYFSKIEKIREYIAEGETYQITFCVKKNFDYDGDPYALYQKLLKFQPVPYPSYISHKDFKIASLSPEMFLKKRGQNIEVKPMKGTLIRNGKLLNNIFGKYQLHFDSKNRAENLMITDLLRNDLGRICDKGSVKTTKLFEVAKYRTVYQMTSSIKGKLDQKISTYNIFKALFPSGSVTGAPKIRAMEIIRELEPEERRIYTGAIGYITPKRDMFFNVPIRTLLLTPKKSNPTFIGHWKLEIGNYSCEMGIGGGITYYSTAEGEYEECEIKRKFLEIFD